MLRAVDQRERVLRGEIGDGDEMALAKKRRGCSRIVAGFAGVHARWRGESEIRPASRAGAERISDSQATPGLQMGKRSGFEVRFATDPEEFADFNSGALVRTFGARAASCGENVAETLSNAAFQPRESGTSSLAAASGLGGRPQWRWKMDELSFKPAGAAFVAVVAALAPGQAGHAAPDQVPGQALGQTAVKAHAAARARETAARDAIVEAAAQLGPAAPFDELSTGTVLHRADPAKGQLGLPFEE